MDVQQTETLRARLALWWADRYHRTKAHAAAAAAAIWARPPALAALSFATVLAVGALTGWGAYLNDYLFYKPAMGLRARLVGLPDLDPRVKIVTFEDRSFEKIGHRPTFHEWMNVAGLMRQAGIKKVLVVGVPAESVDEPGETAEFDGELRLGAVVVNDATNLRATSTSLINPTLLSPGHGDLSRFEVADRVLFPAVQVVTTGTKIGHLNVPENFRMAAAYTLPVAGLVLPSLGLAFAEGLTIADGRVTSDQGEIPMTADGEVYIDFVSSESLKRQSMPLSVFYTKDFARVRTHLYATLEEHLKGGEVAILVPEGYTGTRFLEAPLGKVPSYVATISMVNSVLSGQFLREPAAKRASIACCLFVIGGLLSLRRPRLRLVLGFGATLATPFLGAIGVVYFRMVFPCAQIVIPGLTAWLVALIQHFLRTLTERIALTKDVELGSTVQRLILPKSSTGTVGPWEFWFSYKPYGAMAGDWIQIHQSPKEEAVNLTVIAVGDVVGKGPSAALNTALIAGVWNNERISWTNGGFDFGRLIAAIDRTIETTFAGTQNTTISLAVIQDEAIQVVSGGGAPNWIHVVKEAAGFSAAVIRSNPSDPLGCGFKRRPPPPKVVSLNAGDMLVIYTDGIIDGSAARMKFLRAIKEEPLPEGEGLFPALLALAVAQGAAEALPDDQTFLVIRRCKEALALAEDAPLEKTA